MGPWQQPMGIHNKYKYTHTILYSVFVGGIIQAESLHIFLYCKSVMRFERILNGFMVLVSQEV